MKSATDIIVRPLITEKSTIQKEGENQITFQVAKRANKIEIGKAVEDAFKVKVTKVRTVMMKGKRKRYGRNFGKKPDWKKAVVSLAPGESIEFFEGV